MCMIVCSHNLFNLRHTVLLMDTIGAGTTTPLGSYTNDELATAIYSACINNNTNKVHLFGDEGFLQTISNEIKEKSILDYNNNIIEIKIN